VGSTSAEVARRVSGPGGRARGRVPADEAIVKALDHVFEPLDGLRHERFQTEARLEDGSLTAATAAGTTDYWPTVVPAPRTRSIQLLLLRLRYSQRTPYRQLRSTCLWVAGIAGACTLVWLILGHIG
jgi:hypothetical protein